MNKAPTYFKETVGGILVPKTLSESYLQENDQKLPSVIYSEIRALTANKRTHNHTYYPEPSLRGREDEGTGLISFTRPYPIPIIRDHNTTAGPFGGTASEVYGRVFHPAQFLKVNNEGFVRVMASISHPEAVEGILTGRWLTVSLGSRTESVLCSICNMELTKGMCEHERGEEYETEGFDGSGADPAAGKAPARAMWMIGPIRAKELSFVVSPSDDQAGVVSPHNTQFPTESEQTNQASFLSRILVGNKDGVFDLVTGKRIEESAFFTPPISPRKGFHFIGEGKKGNKERTNQPKPQSDTKENQVNPAGFHGAGQYILGGGEHEHLVALDDRGYGNSGPAYKPTLADYSKNPPDSNSPNHPAEPGTSEDDNPNQQDDQRVIDRHIHDVVAGAVSPAGEDNHVHNLIPKDVPDRRDPHESKESEDSPLTFATLFMLPDTDPDAGKTSLEMTEAVLTAKTRNALPNSAFCGPNRSFPAHDKAHVRAGLSYLDRSNLTPEQKSRTRACIIRRGKSMGMDMSGNQKKEMMYAARLEDLDHRVEIDLYPLPTNCEELDTVLGQVKAVPHLAEERDQILSRLAAHSREFLKTADWQSRFGNLSVCESGPPISIKLTAENYGLLYSVIQTCPGSFHAPEKDKEEAEGDCGCDKGETETTEESTQDSTKESTEETTEQLVTGVTEGQPMKGMDELKAELVEAYSNSVALYQFALRKPQSRGKTIEELVEKLSSRSPNSLKDTLSDLKEEWMAQDPSVLPTLPRLVDPTSSKESKSEDGVIDNTSTSKTSADVEETKDSPEDERISLSSIVAEELDMDEDDPDSRIIYRLFSGYQDQSEVPTS